jgi:S1-C subfamily serine protease
MKFKNLLAAMVVGAVALTTAGCAGAASGTGSTEGQEKLSQPQRIAKAKPSVVHLQGKSGGGSGVVVDGDRGLVLTNAHVALGLEGMRARVGDDSSSETPAQLVAAAPCEDLAVVRLVNKPANLQAIQFGDSSTVQPGDHVTVLGYQGSFEEQRLGDTVKQAQQLVATDGNVSAAEVAATPDPSLPRYASTIQHQAPTNPGNSGGPLIDDEGLLVGINTLGNPDAQGQFYSISVNRVQQLLPTLMAGKSQANLGWDLVPLAQVDLQTMFAEDPDFGTQGGAALGQEVAGILDQEGIDGLYVMGTETGSPAKDAKLYYGDLLTSIEGEPVTKLQDVCDLVLAKRPGQKVRVSGYIINSTSDRADILDSWTVEVKIP